MPLWAPHLHPGLASRPTHLHPASPPSGHDRHLLGHTRVCPASSPPRLQVQAVQAGSVPCPIIEARGPRAQHTAGANEYPLNEAFPFRHVTTSITRLTSRRAQGHRARAPALSRGEPANALPWLRGRSDCAPSWRPPRPPCALAATSLSPPPRTAPRCVCPVAHDRLAPVAWRFARGPVTVARRRCSRERVRSDATTLRPSRAARPHQVHQGPDSL